MNNWSRADADELKWPPPRSCGKAPLKEIIRHCLPSFPKIVQNSGPGHNEDIKICAPNKKRERSLREAEESQKKADLTLRAIDFSAIAA